jgi:hypothetical protein
MGVGTWCPSGIPRLSESQCYLLVMGYHPVFVSKTGSFPATCTSEASMPFSVTFQHNVVRCADVYDRTSLWTTSRDLKIDMGDTHLFDAWWERIGPITTRTDGVTYVDYERRYRHHGIQDRRFYYREQASPCDKSIYMLRMVHDRYRAQCHDSIHVSTSTRGDTLFPNNGVGGNNRGAGRYIPPPSMIRPSPASTLAWRTVVWW